MDTLILPAVKVDISPELLEQYQEEKQIVVIVEKHLRTFSVYVDAQIRLIDLDSSAEATLVTAANISFYPELTEVRKMTEPAHLVFSSLPESCRRFNLVEPKRPFMIPWVVENIQRNDTDVYRLEI